MENTFPNNWQTVAEVELIYRTKVKASERPQIKQSSDAYRLFLENWDKDKIELQEVFKVIFLNRGERVLGLYCVSTGSTIGTLADPRLILAAALKANALSLIMAHNHPSGNTYPSDNDKRLTEKIKQGAALLDLKLMDHLIITAESYYSFADNGLI